jgi:PRTRC genetic system protein C
MAITVSPITRVFKYNGMTLPDLNPTLSADQVRELHAVAYPELANAKTHVENKTGPGDTSSQIITFNVSVGTRG